MLMINLELALITPPVGMNLFVIKGITDAPLAEVIRGSCLTCCCWSSAYSSSGCSPAVAMAADQGRFRAIACVDAGHSPIRKQPGRRCARIRKTPAQIQGGPDDA